MNPKQLACFACGAAFLLGACSGDNSAGTSSGSGGGADGAEAPSGSVPDTVNLANAEETLATANTRFANAQTAVGRAIAAATAAAAGTGDLSAARDLIDSAREAITAAVEAANAAVTAAADGSAADIGAAARALDRANTFRTEQTTALDNALASFSWFGRRLARFKLLNGEAQMPLRGGDNTVSIERIPRTIPTSATDNTQKVNPDAFTSTTFKDVMYEDGKEVFSITDDAEGGDEFKVGGYIGSDNGTETLDHASHMHTGIKLTSDGIVIRTGGSYANPSFPNYEGGSQSDFTDTRRKITTRVSDGFTNANRLRGQNGWDLELTFREPHITPVAGGGVSSWTGNSAFYWKSLVPAADSQLETDGAYYASGAFNRPDGFNDLGTYEVWLSNHIGVDTNLEPAAGAGVADCPDGSRGTSCPSDDTHYYLKYAAYGLFVYTADRTTFRSGNDGRKGRMQTLHFGYSAFGSGSGQATTDIGTEITNATFSGQTLAYAVTGQPENQEWRDSKLLRGDATFTVSIPKTGNGSINGRLENFEEWTGQRWRPFTTNFSVTLSGTSNISDDGTFSGNASASPDTRSADFPSRLPSSHANYAQSGGIIRGYGAVRQYKGSFYGPRTDSDDLEVAGSYRFESLNSTHWELYGSFGAKQRPDS